VTTAAGAGTNTSDDFDIAITWVDLTRYKSQAQKGNCESAPSAPVTAKLPATGNVFVVSIAGLNPPVSGQPASTLPLCVVPYGNAAAWNVYVGKKGCPLYLQNSEPIPLATASYALSGDPVLSGYTADEGQFAEQYYSFQNIVQRA
jgi:hypothetical protein